MTQENERRVRRVVELTDILDDQYEVGEFDTNVTDVLADLLHYCKFYGVDFDNQLRIARTHFEEEQ